MLSFDLVIDLHKWFLNFSVRTLQSSLVFANQRKKCFVNEWINFEFFLLSPKKKSQHMIQDKKNTAVTKNQCLCYTD